MIEIKNLSKTFKTADSSLDALKNVSLTINDGDIYGIIGMINFAHGEVYMIGSYVAFIALIAFFALFASTRLVSIYIA